MKTLPIPDVLSQIAKFGLVGIVATLVHATVGYLLVRRAGVDGLWANAGGFAVAWWVSFAGHYAFTFGARAERLRSFIRFVPHSVAMFALGSGVASLVAVGVQGVPETVLPVIGAFVVPIFSFLSSKFFVFREV